MNSRVRLRPTRAADLDFIGRLQQDAALQLQVEPWERSQHEAALRFADFRHFVVESGAGLEPVGIAVLGGCLSPVGAIELKHLLVQPQSQDLCRSAMRMAKRLAFDELGAHRVWLYVAGRHAEGQALCEQEGFQLEGCLRDAMRGPGNKPAGGGDYDALTVWAMLQQEFAARRIQGLELFA